VTAIWEVSIGHDEDLTWWLQAVRERWPDTKVITEGEFGLEWRKHTPNNAALNYRFDAKGTGAPGSEKELEIKWYMNREFRLALIRDWVNDSPPLVLDFTRYDLKAAEPQGLEREWSLMNVLNQKGTRRQDAPMPLQNLSSEDQRRIYARYPGLKKLAIQADACLSTSGPGENGQNPNTLDCPELERSLIAERVHAGIRNARAKGKRPGRPRTAVDAARIAALRAQGCSWSTICRETGIGKGTAQRAFYRATA
jgi:uncharacterized protein DUF3864